MRKIEIYDTTLRDGAQAEEISFSLEDKIRIALKLDEFGVDYIEGGWPGSNPKDAQFFKEIRDYKLKNAKIVAFGSTHHPSKTPEKDENLQNLLKAETEVVTIFGKSWKIHVTEGLKISPEKNLEIVENSIKFLKNHGKRVFFDAEHFFDGFKEDKDFALSVLKTAKEAGAEVLVLCDTNGGTLPHELREIIKTVKNELGDDTKLGIHAHNDSECAVANSIEAVLLGISQVQGTINGIGERCGNANLCSIIPSLVLKLGFDCQAKKNLHKLTALSKYVCEIANLTHPGRLPFVGRSAFAHKGGVHVSAVMKNPAMYEHIDPSLVGNTRRVLVSELSGKSNILYKIRELGIELNVENALINKIVEEIKKLEAEGYEFEAAEASFELLVYTLLGEPKEYFELLSYRVIDTKEHPKRPFCEATVLLRVPPKVGEVEHTAALGYGPVHALDNALRKALERFYPVIKEMSLEDYKVRVLPGLPGTASKVRVFILSKSGNKKWGTVGVSTDILEASCKALVDSYTYKLFLEKRKKS